MFGEVELERPNNNEKVKSEKPRHVKAEIIRGAKTFNPIIKVTFLETDNIYYLHKGCIIPGSRNFSDNELKEIYTDCLNQISLMDNDDIPFMKNRDIVFTITPITIKRH